MKLPAITPGNWRIESDRADFRITSATGCCQHIARVDASETQSEHEGTANAVALAAVPELLSALLTDRECLLACRKWMGERPESPQFPYTIAAAMIIDALDLSIERNRTALLSAGCTE